MPSSVAKCLWGVKCLSGVLFSVGVCVYVCKLLIFLHEVALVMRTLTKDTNTCVCVRARARACVRVCMRVRV